VIIKDGQHFRPVAIQLGTEQNGLSEVTQGLNVGEKVVSSGQFLIDSEASLNGVLARLSTHTELNHD
jgi:Cu(I)/Ag(I) efflux system membrane fusion protein